MHALSLSRVVWAIAIAIDISIGGGKLSAQVAATVTVLADKPLKYGDMLLDATVPAAGLGLGTSVYANNWADPALPGLIKASGIEALRYPGGSYADMYNWSTATGNAGAYAAAHSDFANFIHVLDLSRTTAVITVNYGSDTTNTIGGQPSEAAAWVAYSNSDPAIYGSTNDVMLGKDPAGVNWYTAGYWAKLRSSTPEEYKAWASASGEYDPTYSFLAIHHPAAMHIKYWEIGNEVGGNGFYGPQWEYDLHAPYKGGDSKSNTGRKGNPLLSPVTYGHNFIRFVRLMKRVDPSIKIGTGFAASRGDRGDETLLRMAGDFIDFGIIHWYPAGPVAADPVASLPDAIISGPSALSQLVDNLCSVARVNTYKGPGNFGIALTEFNYSAQNASMASYALFVADAYVTGFENGVFNMDLQEMIGKTYLGDGPPVPGSEFYGIQMVRRFASPGDRFISTICRDAKLRVHAIKRADATVALLFINEGKALDTSQDREITATIMGAPPPSKPGTLYLFGAANITDSKVSPPTARTVQGRGNSFTVIIPQQTIGVLVFSEIAPLPTMLFSLSALLIRRRLPTSHY